MGPVARQLPTNATAPVVRKFDPNASPVLNIAFTGAALDQLYDVASNQMQPALESVPGVGQVSVKLTFDPPWDKDRMSDEAKLALGMF